MSHQPFILWYAFPDNALCKPNTNTTAPILGTNVLVSSRGIWQRIINLVIVSASPAIKFKSKAARPSDIAHICLRKDHKGLGIAYIASASTGLAVRIVSLTMVSLKV